MQTILQKTLTLHTATAYLIFERETERPDIQEYLQGKTFNNPLIEERVQAYLKNIGLLDDRCQHTKKGYEAQKTGKIFVREEGKYKIWFTEKDEHFGDKIFYFKRVEARHEYKEVQKLDISFEKEGHYFLPPAKEKDTFCPLKLVKCTEILGNRNPEKEQIQLRWEWNEVAGSCYIFEGKIDRETIKTNKISSSENLENHILRILPTWHRLQKRAKMEYDMLSPQARKRFEITYNLPKKWRGFEGKIQQLRLMPVDEREAIIWRDYLLTEAAKEKYYTKADFEQLVAETHDNQGFAAYKASLNVPSIQDFAAQLRHKDKAVQSAAYWHLMATVDINSKLRIEN